MVIRKHWSPISGLAEEIMAERPAPDQADVVAAEKAFVAAGVVAVSLLGPTL